MISKINRFLSLFSINNWEAVPPPHKILWRHWRRCLLPNAPEREWQKVILIFLCHSNPRGGTLWNLRRFEILNPHSRKYYSVCHNNISSPVVRSVNASEKVNVLPKTSISEYYTLLFALQNILFRRLQSITVNETTQKATLPNNSEHWDYIQWIRTRSPENIPYWKVKY